LFPEECAERVRAFGAEVARLSNWLYGHAFWPVVAACGGLVLVGGVGGWLLIRRRS
jgi:hypothetical protein